MDNDQVRLDVKTGWKIYQVVAGTVALAGLLFMIKELVGIMDYAGAGAIFLMIFFSFCCAGVLYSMGYAFKHRIIFDASGMRRKGMVKEKTIPYHNISEFRFSDSFWKISPVGNLLGNDSIIVIDFKYRDPEMAKGYLREVVQSNNGIEVVD